VVAAHEVEESAGIIAHFLAQLPQGHELCLTFAHWDFLTTPEQADELDQSHFQAVTRLPHRLEPRAHASHIAMVVSAQHINETLEPALALLQVISNVGGKVSLHTVLANDDSILLVPKGGRSKPGSAVLLVQVTLSLQALQRPVNSATVAERSLRV